MNDGGAALDGGDALDTRVAVGLALDGLGVDVVARYGFDSIHALASLGAVAPVVAVPPVVIVVTLVPLLGARVLVYVGAPYAVDVEGAADEPGISEVSSAPPAYGFAGTNVGDACCAPAARDASTLASVIVNSGSERFVTGRLLVARATGGEHRDVLKEACAEVGGARTRTAGRQ